jgi:hypothetical protein
VVERSANSSIIESNRNFGLAIESGPSKSDHSAAFDVVGGAQGGLGMASASSKREMGGLPRGKRRGKRGKKSVKSVRSVPNTLLKNRLFENDDLLFSGSDQKMIEIPDPDDDKGSQEQKSRSRSLKSDNIRR